ncbi:hypothetical protein [uncultured Amnibacterium sp.]|uniref:hypothetical protein n=1 Tax=uncultured Amnibacterium sp. TaxID=1631851 RepID=UPI0035CC0AFD
MPVSSMPTSTSTSTSTSTVTTSTSSVTATSSQSELTSLKAAIAAQTPVSAGPVSLVDRLAMRAGLALILWSRGRAVAASGTTRIDDSDARDWRTSRPLRQQRPFC